MSAPDLYWHCLQCGAHDPVEPTGGPESYALGDWEKCIEGRWRARAASVQRPHQWTDAQARVQTLEAVLRELDAPDEEDM